MCSALTRRRMLVLSGQIDAMQAALGRDDLSTAQRLAAELPLNART